MAVDLQDRHVHARVKHYLGFLDYWECTGIVMTPTQVQYLGHGLYGTCVYREATECPGLLASSCVSWRQLDLVATFSATLARPDLT